MNMQLSKQAARARGFTLMETVLAMVLGGMVLLGSLGVFLGLRNMESTFAARFDRTSELGITHTIMTRAMLSLQMKESQAAQVTRAPDTDTDSDEAVEIEVDPRDRMILETDPTTAPDSTGWVPQRFELVNATPPVPAGLATQAAGWYVAQDNSTGVNFSAMNGSQGIVRGVFELRPTGQRERIMQNLGLISPGDQILDVVDETEYQLDTAHEKPNWTLWWRPILTYEGEQMLYGYGPYGDTIGSANEIRARLAGAVPLLRNIERCLWEVFRGDEYIDTYSGLTMSDLPAYAQFEVILTNSQYASWMFEIDWVLGDDPSTDGTGQVDQTLADANDDPDDDSNNGRPSSGPGSQNGTRDVRQFNFSDN